MRKRYHRCVCCGKFMRCIREEWSPTGTLLHYECKCGGYEIASK